jgi:hypothetical protein
VPEGPHFKTFRDLSRSIMRAQPQIQPGGGDRQQCPDHVLPRGWIVQVDRMLHPVQNHAGQHAGQSEAVVAVDVREADARDLGR